MPPVLSWKLGALPCSGRVCRKSPMVILPLASNCWRETTVTGAGVVRSLRRMRDPVTTICSSIGLSMGVSGAASGAAGGAAVDGVAGGGVCCAARPAAQRRVRSKGDTPNRLRIDVMAGSDLRGRDDGRQTSGSARRRKHPRRRAMDNSLLRPVASHRAAVGESRFSRGGFMLAIALLAAAYHACPADLTAWRDLLDAEWIDCHRVADLTTTGNPFTDPQSLTGMGFPPPGTGTLNSHYTNPTSPPVSGLQIDGWFADACNAFQAEPALTAKDGTPFIPGCTPPPIPGQTCVSGCHHDSQFVIRIPDAWDGHLLTAGTPGIRDAFASDFILSDQALEKSWAYVSQDKGNMGANFFRDGTDETASSGTPWV